MRPINNLIQKIKQTRLGSAAGWLLKPRKHLDLIECYLKEQLQYPPSQKQILWCFWDYCGFRFRYRGNLETDYFGAQLYRKSDFIRMESLAHAVRFSWRDSIQEKTFWKIFQDKREFYQAFSEFLHRKWMIVDETTSWESFCSFISSCSGKVFVKSPLGMGGTGVQLWILDSEKELRRLFDLCRSEQMVMEEPLIQCEELWSFSESSVNTLRIITIIDQYDKVHVARCELRMGRHSSNVDNYCGGGLVAQVDVDSGVIFTTGRDKNGKEYIFHPDSGKQIVGFQIPDWSEYKTFACTLAKKYPGMRYVGWDIIKDKAGNFCVIEGNKDAGVGGLESGLLYGLKPLYDALLEGNSRSTKQDK